MSQENDSMTEVTHQSWFSRIGSSIAGAGFGLLLVLIAFPVLFWNEGRAVRQDRSLSQGLREVVKITPDRVDSANAGKLVHVTGEAKALTPAADGEFHITGDYLRVQRQVQMFQWKETKATETKKNLGGSTDTVTNYTYSKVWSDAPISSSDFKMPGHANPSNFPVNNNTFDAPAVAVGAFQLSPVLIAQIPVTQQVVLDPKMIGTLNGDLKKTAKLQGNTLYIGADSNAPAIGDMQVKFIAALPGRVSVMARQVDGTFEPFHADAGGTIAMLVSGTRSADEMIKTAQAGNNKTTWLLRLVGFLLLFFGFMLMFAPLAVLADFIPFLGDLVGGLNAGIAFLLATTLTLTTIALGWVFYRPMIAIPLLLLAAGAMYLLTQKYKAKKQTPQEAAPAV